MKQYLLLTPVTASDFSKKDRNDPTLINTPELKQEAKNNNCTILKSISLKDTTQYYFMSNSTESLATLCEMLELDGTVVEVSGIFDQEIEEV